MIYEYALFIVDQCTLCIVYQYSLFINLSLRESEFRHANRWSQPLFPAACANLLRLAFCDVFFRAPIVRVSNGHFKIFHELGSGGIFDVIPLVSARKTHSKLVKTTPSKGAFGQTLSRT